MGAALEWMSQTEREILFQELVPGARKKGARLSALCPFHNEKTPSFGYRADKDLYHCFGCGQSGDLIKLYGLLRSSALDPKEVFKEFAARYGPALDGRPRPRPHRRPVVPRSMGWQPQVSELSPDQWSERAGLFVQHSVERLWRLPRELGRLRRWGLDDLVVEACRFGWNDQWKVFPGTKWGLAEEVKVKLAPGLVMPLLAEGKVIKIKIRRPEASARPRYRQVEGSSNRLFVYGRGSKVLVVESERDAAMLWGRFRDIGWAAVGLGSASNKPCRLVHDFLKRARVILLALDGDAAGVRASAEFWRKEYDQALRWPVPRSWGKDPGEAAEKDCDLAAWLRDGELAAGLG